MRPTFRVNRREFFIGLLLAGITLALYWPVRGFGLVYYDDPLFLTDSPLIQSGLNWPSFTGAFATVIAANWHPVTTLSFVVDHQLFGTNPGAEHVVNALFHAANAALLFLLLNRLTRSGWRSALVTAVFAWHPLRVESVAWIAERKDVLSGFFFFLTLLGYGCWVKRAEPGPGESGDGTEGGGGRIYYGITLGLFALGLMSKAMLVTVPLVLLLLDVWPLQRLLPVGTSLCGPAPLPPLDRRQLRGNRLRLVWEKWPFFVLTAGFCVLTYWVQKTHAAVVPLGNLGWPHRVANALTSYLRYPGKLFWPTDLAAIYPYRRLDDWLQTSVIALILASISAFVCLQFRRRPWLAVGWFWYLITALPIIGLVQVGETAMADRYTYLPLIGPVIALVWLIPETWTRTVFTRGLLSLGIAAGLAGLVGLTRHQIQYWHDTDRLFSHTLAVTGDNAGAEAGRGYGLEHEGRFSEAVGHFSKAMWLNPEDREYRLKTGELLSQLGEWSEAADTLSVLLGKNPNDVGAHEDLGSALSHLRRYAEARQHWETALRFAPDDPRVLNNLAWLLATCPEARVRDGREAVALAEHACTLTQFKTTRFMGTLAAAQAEAGRFDDAIATARKACDFAAAHGETELFQRNQALLALYKKHQPWHEPANGP